MDCISFPKERVNVSLQTFLCMVSHKIYIKKVYEISNERILILTECIEFFQLSIMKV